MSNFHNPRGVTLSPQRRRELAALAERYGFWVVEDDPYGELWFARPAPPPLLAAAERGAVTYLGTGSKMVAPGLRVAWMVVPDRELRDTPPDADSAA